MFASQSVQSRFVALALAAAVSLVVGGNGSAQAPDKPTLVKEFRLLADNIKIPLSSVSISKDGKTALSMSTGPAVLGLGPQLWNIETGKQGKKLDIKGNVDGLTLAADGRRAVFAIENGDLLLWDTTLGKQVRAFKSSIVGGVKGLAFSPDGTYVATGGGALDEKIHLWHVGTGKDLAPFKGNKRAMPALAFSSDGARLATGGWEGELRIWEVPTRKQLQLCVGHTKMVRCVAFSTDGKQVYTGGADNVLRVWEVATGKEIAKMDDEAGSINCIAVMPDGAHVVTGSGGEFDVELLPKGASLKSKLGKTQAVRVWDVKAGKAVAELADHGSPVLNVTVAPKGRLVTVTYDGMLRIWQVGEGK